MSEKKIGVLLESLVELPAARVEKALREEVGEPSAGTQSLTVDLADVESPIAAALSVPVVVRLRPGAGDAIDVTIEAAERRILYPQFSGSLAVIPLARHRSELRLSGSYHVPLGVLGAAIDATFLAGAARASLQRLIDTLAGKIVERVRREEAAYARRVFSKSL